MEFSAIISFSQHYAGLVAVFITAVFLITPAVWLGIKPHQDTISYTIKHRPEIERILRIALVVGAFFQGWFIGYLVDRFALSLADPGPLLYIGLSLATLGAAFWTTSTSPRTHYYFALYYFFTAPIALLLIGYSASAVAPITLLISLMCVGIYIMGQVGLLLTYRTRGNGYMQYFGFGVLAVWTTIMTFL